MSDTKLIEYVNAQGDSARKRYHEESFGMMKAGWTCVPLNEVANNMAGLYDEARNSVLDELAMMSDGKRVCISLEDLEAMRK